MHNCERIWQIAIYEWEECIVVWCKSEYFLPLVSERQQQLRCEKRPSLLVQDRVKIKRRICFSAICYANEEQQKHSEKKTLLHLNLHFKYLKCFVNEIPHYACGCAVLNSAVSSASSSPSRLLFFSRCHSRCYQPHMLLASSSLFQNKNFHLKMLFSFKSLVWSFLFFFFHLLTLHSLHTI